MTMAKLTQDTLIEALRELRASHPDLPAVSWRIGEYAQELQGDVGVSDTWAVLTAYALEFGGEITARQRYVYRPADVSVEMQSFRLSTVWADVPIVIIGSLPVAELAVAS